MLTLTLFYLLLSNAITLRRDKSILYSRVAIVLLILTALIIYNNLYITFLALSLSITLFSFAGVPPLIGFFAKQMVLSAALDNGYIFMVLIAILTSVISAVYYLAVIKQIFFDKPNYKLNPVLDNINLNAIITDENLIIKKINFKTNNIVISSCLTLIISVLTLIILLFILIPQEWLSMVNILSILLFNI